LESIVASSEKVKVTVSLPEATVDDIRALAEKLGITASEVLRRAVRTEKFLDEVEEADGKFLIEKADHSIQQVIRR
jgi:Arc/MetJ-type ribon-helix-helix transcriptional regulator